VADKRLLITVETRMSDYGYWVVSTGVASGRKVDMMVAATGISPMQAESLARTGLNHVLDRGQA
jgi:hypothetical protein